MIKMNEIIGLLVFLLLYFLLSLILTKKSKKQLREEMVYRLVSSGEYGVAEAWDIVMEEYK